MFSECRVVFYEGYGGGKGEEDVAYEDVGSGGAKVGKYGAKAVERVVMA